MDADEQAWHDELNSPEFLHGIEIGKSLGFYDAASEAQRAFEAGEIELWIEFQKPKSIEDWKVWESEHGPTKDMHDRWSKD